MQKTLTIALLITSVVAAIWNLATAIFVSGRVELHTPLGFPVTLVLLALLCGAGCVVSLTGRHWADKAINAFILGGVILSGIWFAFSVSGIYDLGLGATPFLLALIAAGITAGLNSYKNSPQSSIQIPPPPPIPPPPSMPPAPSVPPKNDTSPV